MTALGVQGKQNWQVPTTETGAVPISNTGCAYADFLLSLLVCRMCCHSTYFILSTSPNNLAK